MGLLCLHKVILIIHSRALHGTHRNIYMIVQEEEEEEERDSLLMIQISLLLPILNLFVHVCFTSSLSL